MQESDEMRMQKRGKKRCDAKVRMQYEKPTKSASHRTLKKRSIDRIFAVASHYHVYFFSPVERLSILGKVDIGLKDAVILKTRMKKKEKQLDLYGPDLTDCQGCWVYLNNVSLPAARARRH